MAEEPEQSEKRRRSASPLPTFNDPTSPVRTLSLSDTTPTSEDIMATIASHRANLPFAFQALFDRMVKEVETVISKAVKLEHRMSVFASHANNGTLPTSMTHKKLSLSLPCMDEQSLARFREAEEAADRVYNASIASCAERICRDLRQRLDLDIGDHLSQLNTQWLQLMSDESIRSSTSESVLFNVDLSFQNLMQCVRQSHIADLIQSARQKQSMKLMSNVASKMDQVRVQDRVLAAANDGAAPILQDVIRAEVIKSGKERAPRKTRTRSGGMDKKQEKIKKKNRSKKAATQSKGGKNKQSH